MTPTREARFTAPQPHPYDLGRQMVEALDYPDTTAEHGSNGNARQRRPARRQAPRPAEAPASSNGHDADGHDTNGQFAKGNRGGPGNPYNRQIAEFRKQFLAASTPAVFRQVVDALIAKALGGDGAAMKLYFLYVMGKPADAVDPDRVDFDECDVLCQTQANRKLPWHEILKLPYLETMLELARIFRPASDARYRKQLGDGVKALDAQTAKQRQRAEAQRARREAKRAAPTNVEAPIANGGNGTAADAAGLAADRDAASGADRDDTGPVVPDAAAHGSPLANGGNGRAANTTGDAGTHLSPIANGEYGTRKGRAAKTKGADGDAATHRSPLTNGENGRAANSTGDAGTHQSPIANGENGTRKGGVSKTAACASGDAATHHLPIANGENGRAAKTKGATGDAAEHDPPSANGV
jgi:hypothetical protein